MLASVVVAEGVGDGDWWGRNGADTGLRLAVIAEFDVGDVIGDPVDVEFVPGTLFRLVGRLANPPTVGTGSTVAAALTVGPDDSGAASSNLN